MPSYKLRYFNLKGVAELARLIFAAAGVEYEDERLSFPEWQAIKNDQPFGHLPVLIEDGTVLSASQAIYWYLAEKFDLAGKNKLETAHCIEVKDSINDVNTEIRKVVFKGFDAQAGKILFHEIGEEHKKLNEGAITTLRDNLAKFFKAHGGSSGYIIGDQLTYADLAVYDFCDQAIKLPGVDIVGVFGAEPLFLRHKELLESNPKLKAYLDKRPERNPTN